MRAAAPIWIDAPASLPIAAIGRRLQRSGLWCALFVLPFAAVLLLTWQRWTDPAIPVDTGREMIVPQMLVAGKLLYRDIRCFYGPVGYWINAGVMALFGTTQQVLWWTNVVRFAAMMALLWVIARRLLGSLLVALALGSYVYAYFFSFMWPYSASFGWGTLFVVAAIACMVPQLHSYTSGQISRGWSQIAAVFLALAMATKHEIALCAAVLLIALCVDAAWRSGSRRAAVLNVAALIVAGLVPLAMVCFIVLRSVSLATVIHENLWLPDLMNALGGAAGYAMATVLGPWKLILLTEWAGLLMTAIGGVSLLAGRRAGFIGRQAAPSLCAPGSEDCERSILVPSRNDSLAWVWLLGGVFIVVAAETWQLHTGATNRGVLGFPKPRLRELIETASLVCVPLAIGLLVVCVRRGWLRGIRQTWLRLGPRTQLGMLCLVAYLVMTTRDLPTGLGLVRCPFAPIVAAWAAAIVVPRWMRWPRSSRVRWSAGVGVLLLGGTLCSIDNLVFLQTRPSAFVSGPTGSLYVWQRRMPYRPQWYQDAMDLVAKHQDKLARSTLACAPEGAWINALYGWDSPTRDVPWGSWAMGWLLDDFRTSPPDYVLVMEPEVMARYYAPIYGVIVDTYVPIDMNASGMVLYARGEDKPVAAATTDDRGRSASARGMSGALVLHRPTAGVTKGVKP